jgi:glycerophosphoryl diester phosphodiesterase
MNWLLETPIAHRGLHSSEIPENSLAAFEAACKAGFGIELDVHMSNDHEIVVFHDYKTARLTGVDMSVASTSRTELQSLKLAGTEQHIPTLREVLNLVDGRVPVLVELKSPGRSDGTFEAKVYELLEGYSGEFTVQSFDPNLVAWFAKNAPSFIRGQLSCAYKGGGSMPVLRRFILSNLLMNWRSRPHYIGYDINDMPMLSVRIARAIGLPIVAWTVVNSDQLKIARRYADNIIFEQIDPSNP